MSEPPKGGEEAVVARLSRLLDRSLRELGKAGQGDLACRIAADAWALLEGGSPAEARRFNGTLHYLTLALPPPDDEAVGGRHRRPRESML
ncbi:MAG: hypothetical protein ACREQM_12805 [Candidatus Dormibacteraceae bacterium]